MNTEGPTDSAEEFDPYSFAEWWCENVWPEKYPDQVRRYIEQMKREEKKNG